MTTPGLAGSAIIAQTEQWLGVPYTYGGGRGTAASARLNGVDCSGLVYQVFTALGIDPGTDTVSQFNNPAAVTVPDLAAAQPGDLVFFGSPAGGTQEHVGIYLGGGAMIDAPHTGATVRVDQVSGFGPILGIKRLSGGVAAAGLTDSPTGSTVDPVVTTAASSSSGLGSSITRLLVGLVLLGLALALVGLGVHAGTKAPAQKDPQP